MAGMNDEFRHERLKLPGGFMRLLQIQGSTGGGSGSGVANISSGNTQKDTISLRITQYAIHRLPRYVAISYTWGSALTTRPIRVNGRPFHVRLNLWHLLWHLRQRGESRFLWIDALCIDQKNLEERNFHVRLMGNIYDKAVIAIVWLGLPSDDRRQARVLEFIAEMSAFGRAKHGAKGAAMDEADILAKFRRQFLTEASAQRWVNVLELCRGTYWTRTWIIQEFLQASQVQVLCGTASLEWVCFEDVVRTLRNVLTAVSHEQQQPQPPKQQPQPGLPSFVTQFMQTLPVRLTIRRIFHTSSTLEELVSEFYDSRCAERRDKIYGILGIADDCGERVEPPDNTVVHIGPKPDYSKHIMDVYFEVFDYLLSPANPGTSPLQAIYLTQKSLGLSENDLVSYVNYLSQQNQQGARAQDANASLSDLEARLFRSKLPLRPDYINVISEVLPGWTSMRDLRQRLEHVDWARYVGHEVKRKPLAARLSTSGSGLTATMTTTSQRRKSSFNSASLDSAFDTAAATASSGTSTPPTGRAIRAPLPENMLDNVVYMAEHAHDTLSALYNYDHASPSHGTSHTSSTTDIPLSHIQLSPHEKRTHLNPTLTKPSIIIESCPAKGVDPVRIGFACTEARAGDLVCQFNGLEQTLIMRRGDAAGGGGPGLSLVGMARMVSHCAVRERGVHPAAMRAPGALGEMRWSGCVLPPPTVTMTAATMMAVEKGLDELVVDTGAAEQDVDAYNYTVDLDPVSWWEVLR